MQARHLGTLPADVAIGRAGQAQPLKSEARRGDEAMAVRTVHRRFVGLAVGFWLAMRCVLLGGLFITVAGCDKHTPIAGGYEFIVPPNMGPDSHPGSSLGFHGKEVYHALDGHTFLYCRDYAAFVHDGMIVFLITMPDEDKEHYRYEISPQLVVMRG